ncbi:MAG: hypothetical protein BGO51_02495 [Rhodospirillales bacterium 69-11]|nr:hypothetical protein [Rhodospirillales bacterium]OJW29171.1 MAG: hypothetical protein BGO51_02495 [Rhodospirillales bacterium 69-11]
MSWLAAIRRYLVAVSLGNLLWEAAQLPLYTLWHTGTPAALTAAVLHCTAGDVLIAALTIVAALVVFGSSDWPRAGFARVVLPAVALGLGYTIYSEYMNTAVRQSWAYSEFMPRLPVIGTGLAPFAQWIVVPPLALVWACRRSGRRDHDV